MKKKTWAVMIAALLIPAMLLSGCSSGSGNKAAGDVSVPDSYYTGAYGGEVYDYAEAETNYSFVNMASAAETQKTAEDRKVISTARMDIEAKDAEECFNVLRSRAASLGGYESGYDVTRYTGYSVVHATFKLPPAMLEEFVNSVGENAQVINSSLSTEEITDSYFDSEVRLETMRKSLESYYTLLERVSTIEEIILLQSKIDSITLEIESLEGRLRLWNSQVTMATLHLYIRQTSDPVVIKKEIQWDALTLDDMGYLIRSGFMTITNYIVSTVQMLIIFVVGYSPLWIIGIPLFFVLRRWWRKRKVGDIRAARRFRGTASPENAGGAENGSGDNTNKG